MNKYSTAIIAALIVIFALVSPASAQMMIVDIDFDGNNAGYTVEYGSYETTGGNSNGNILSERLTDLQLGAPYLGSYAVIKIPISGTIEYIAFDYYTNGNGFAASGLEYHAYDADDILIDIGSTTSSVTNGVWKTDLEWADLNIEIPSGGYILLLHVNTGYDVYDADIEHRIDNVEITGTDLVIDGGGGGLFGGPYQPIPETLHILVETPRDDLDQPNGFSRITAIPSNAIPNATPVYASVGGTIGNVTVNTIELMAEVNGEQWELLYRNLQTVYVQPGDEVDAGCIIGLAGPAVTTIDSDEPVLNQILFRAINIDAVEFLDWELWSSYEGSRICGSLATSAECLSNNPYLNNRASGWTLEKGISGAFPGAQDQQVILPGTTAISQYVALDSGSYYVTLGVILFDRDSGALEVSLGEDTITESVYVDAPGEPPVFGVSRGEEQIIMVGPFSPTTPDLSPDLYKLRIENAYLSYTVAITYACVHGDAETPIPPFGACYYNTLDDLTTTGESLADPLGTPYIALDKTETITGDDLTLSGYADTDATYDVEVRLMASEDDESSNPASTDSDLLLSFDDGVTDYATVSSFSIPHTRRSFGLVTFEIEIPAGDTVTADMVITHDQVASTDPEFLYIASVCILPPALGWPGYEPPPGGGGGGSGGGSSGGGVPSPDPGTCAPVIAPASTDLWKWIVWLFQAIERFIRCTLLGEISKAVGAIFKVIDWIGMLGVWLGAVIQLLAYWLFSLIGWLGTTIGNLVTGIVGALWNALIGLDVFKWFFDAIALGDLLLDALMLILNASLVFIKLLFDTLMTLAQIIATMWTALQAGFNGTSTTTTGLPDCLIATSADPLYGLCQGLDFLDYTVAAFPAIGAIIIALMGAIALRTIFMTISLFGEKFSEAG